VWSAKNRVSKALGASRPGAPALPLLADRLSRCSLCRAVCAVSVYRDRVPPETNYIDLVPSASCQHNRRVQRYRVRTWLRPRSRLPHGSATPHAACSSRRRQRVPTSRTSRAALVRSVNEACIVPAPLVASSWHPHRPPSIAFARFACNPLEVAHVGCVYLRAPNLQV